jgi:tRNA (guanosine-2'-O-)-methyltransferase
VHGVAYIPQVGRVGSLNVAVATAIALAEARRREWTRPASDKPPEMPA